MFTQQEGRRRWGALTLWWEKNWALLAGATLSTREKVEYGAHPRLRRQEA